MVLERLVTGHAPMFSVKIKVKISYDFYLSSDLNFFFGCLERNFVPDCHFFTEFGKYQFYCVNFCLGLGANVIYNFFLIRFLKSLIFEKCTLRDFYEISPKRKDRLNFISGN